MRHVILPLLLWAWLPHGQAQATERGRPLPRLADLLGACEEAKQPGRRRLYELTFAGSALRFGPYSEDEGVLPIDVRRNLRAYRGRGELFPAHLEPAGFIASRERAAALTRVTRGARLRLGFFLGFDNHQASLCLVRPAGVTTARFDLAYLELVARDGQILAREDTERLRAWLDDPEAITGAGPRASIGGATLADRSGVAPDWIQRALASEGRGATGRELAQCHRDGVSRGASGEGQVVIRLRVTAATGRVTAADVELSSVGDSEEARCIAAALERVPIAPQPGDPRTLDVSVPVQLAE